jgi:hypothetical protein
MASAFLSVAIATCAPAAAWTLAGGGQRRGVLLCGRARADGRAPAARCELKPREFPASLTDRSVRIPRHTARPRSRDCDDFGGLRRSQPVQSIVREHLCKILRALGQAVEDGPGSAAAPGAGWLCSRAFRNATLWPPSGGLFVLKGNSRCRISPPLRRESLAL